MPHNVDVKALTRLATVYEVLSEKLSLRRAGWLNSVWE